ncbi:NAD(P)/FAD-dependent oxidoreductase [Nocardia tengchongensis]|uniref:NAD(P)/FAD-dependent oxidoreductase n=1 Tax=Nocardia tengchongensis TaxID=2055889 RepID=UPI002484C5D9|nr:FAD-dependent oxidoreductase [Nocardia tengchongensis]
MVVGGSQAGCATAAALRRFGFDGEITVIGDELHRPYARPPLSKGILGGTEPDDSVFLSTADDLDIVGGVRAVRLDVVRKRVELSDKDCIRYDGLVVATGARARRLSQYADEITLRTLDDAIQLRERFDGAREVAVAGGGFLGFEIASTAASLGKAVTVVDQIAPLAGRLGPLLSDIVLIAAAEAGVKVRVSTGGVELGRSGHGGDRLQSADGAVLAEADVVVTAVGDVPNVEWLRGSGIALNGGVVVDGDCRVSPDIVAAGDVTSAPGVGGRYGRTPHWWNASEQATTAAATLLGREPDTWPGSRVPFFWTEVFGLRIRLAGHLPPFGEPVVIGGSLADRSVLLAWSPPDGGTGIGTAAAVNFPISAPKLIRLAEDPTARGGPR